ncbi:DUF4102 domain-containing protein [Mesorhizobium sp. B2-5-9]|uniref:tyrosine-type recombinase/integrase n=1 Tax=Mesorhizobium sp. B2-5-9 TaxID=2589921 RepID=UPI00112C71C0|nr:site-specific integrase [Mesorhizobium sp. B2-5-9]TPK16683.1 DUF4102 domain-containing protein [Mesorhizobium sp. B2-5-9]
MARALNKLSDTAIRMKDLPAGRYGDGGGLYLYVAGASRSWVFVGVREGKRIERGLGAYPKPVSLGQAREKATECRALLKAGKDPTWVPPVEEKPAVPTFADAAKSLIAKIGKGWKNEKHRAQWEMTLGDAYCKRLREKPVSDIDTDDIVAVLEPVWADKPETAQRLRGRIERVLDFAKVKGWRTGENPALWRGHLSHLLAKPEKLSRGHHPAMPYSDVPAFVVRLRASEGLSALALAFLVLTAARSGEVLGATWPEIDLDEKLWTVPAARMKAKREHRVPLTEPALAILRPLYDARLSDDSHVFPGEDRRGNLGSLSVMALTMAMRRMGVGQFTPHGFRSAFRDWAGDQTSFPREVAEAALAHKVGDAVENAYRRSDALEKRRKLMAAWSNYLVAPLNKGNLRLVGGNRQ